MNKGIRMICVTLAAMLISAAVSGCAPKDAGPPPFTEQPGFSSYRSIPGVTEDEIKAVEALKKECDYFVYGMTPSTEAFTDDDGNIGGFSAHFCEWLTGLFGIPFKPALFSRAELDRGLETGAVDFTGDMTPTGGSSKLYYSTDAIAQRQAKMIRLKDAESFTSIVETRAARLAFARGGFKSAYILSSFEYGPYETVMVSRTDEAYEALKSGKADAFFDESGIDGSLETYEDTVISDYLPLIFTPVTLTTQNQAYMPIISLVQKALQNGAQQNLTKLYNLGYKDYQKHRLYEMLDDEERDYIREHPTIPFVAQYYNYPICFYNTVDGQWQGIVFDLLAEAGELTGLSFEVVNDQREEFADLQKKLESGEAYMIARMVRSIEREGKFLFSKTSVMSDKYMLISRTGLRNVSINEIQYLKVGLVKDTAQGKLFQKWFPYHEGITWYDGTDSAFGALDQGEIDAVMSSYSQLLFMTNYREFKGYKANVVFNAALDANLGFNNNESVLCSIIEKAFYLIDVAKVADDWSHKTYDYQKKLMQARQPWLIGISALLLCVIVLIFALFQRNRRMGKQLEKLVAERTSQLEIKTSQLESQASQLMSMEEEARNASEAKSRFLAAMSHEMRTPLNAIIGLSELVLGAPGLSEEAGERLEKVHNSGMTLLGIVNDILDISKIESNKFEIAPVEYDTPSLINDTVSQNVVRIGEKPIEFKLRVDEGLLEKLFGDDLRIRQILNNLLSNAIKYTNSGTVELSISSEIDGNRVWLVSCVRDSGIGIKPEDIAKLFSDYNQVDVMTNRKVEGTGLGLAITKRLVDAMDGTIKVESEYGKGSAFSVRLPQGLVSGSVIGKEVAENLASLHYTASKRNSNAKFTRVDMGYAHVLVVDDIPTNLDVVKGMLKPYSIMVDCAASGEQAIDMIRAENPRYSAVFMDHMMPGMDGIEATRIIREEIGTEYARNIPVIALTANAVAGNEEMFLHKGFQAFISKPIDIMKLDSALRRWVRDKDLERKGDGIGSIDLQMALKQFAGDEEALGQALRSYAANTLPLLRSLDEYLEAEDLSGYAITVGGIKGSSYGVCAQEAGDAAKGLEIAAKAGRLKTVKTWHGKFIGIMESLLDSIDAALGRIDGPPDE